jgi:hypothetical protein
MLSTSSKTPLPLPTEERLKPLLGERCPVCGARAPQHGSADFHGPGHKLFSKFRAFSTYGHEPALGPIAG